MKKFSRFVLGMSLAASCACVTAAQQIPKVLQIQREFLKPGKAGAAHEKAESAFVEAMRRAKWPTNYIGMTSMSGKSRALFFTSYESFEAMEKDISAVGKNASLSAALEHANLVDGELQQEGDQGLFYLHEEMSLRPRADLSAMRYMEITSYHVKPGKGKEWIEAVKMVKDAYEKGVPESHWGMFEQMYGGDGEAYLVLISHKTLAEIDKGFAMGKQFQEAMGEEGMKKLQELVSGCVVSSQHQLFAFNAQMSYVNEEWIKADPGFWKPKAASAGAAKVGAEEKKAKQ